MQIDWVNILANVTIGSIVLSAIVGAGSAITWKVMQLREARAAVVTRRREEKNVGRVL